MRLDLELCLLIWTVGAAVLALNTSIITACLLAKISRNRRAAAILRELMEEDRDDGRS